MKWSPRFLKAVSAIQYYRLRLLGAQSQFPMLLYCKLVLVLEFESVIQVSLVGYGQITWLRLTSQRLADERGPLGLSRSQSISVRRQVFISQTIYYMFLIQKGKGTQPRYLRVNQVPKYGIFAVASNFAGLRWEFLCLERQLMVFRNSKVLNVRSKIFCT